ncbi:hypothetical protein KY385_00740 [Candidatus Parcubacteria bacterium]|nr:hypothetical protein [Candidatus Parcubacteria bacterium]
MNLQELIDKGEEIKNERYDSPVVGMWKNDVEASVTTYGDSVVKIYKSAVRFGAIARGPGHAQQMHIERIQKVQQLLEELMKRNPSETQAQSRLINQKKEEAKASLESKFGTATFNGPVTFGDNSPANNIQVGELMLAIISEAEKKLPDGPEKEEILEKLKTIVANPTFAALAGASLPEIIKRLLG